MSGVSRVSVVVGRDENGVWFVRCPSIPGCVSTGATREEAMAGIKKAIQLCLRLQSGADGEGSPT
jgi:predicted RNase H-like HicB family nuclease